MIRSELSNSLALVLSSSVYQENSAIITLAGENGLFSVLARGIYKPKSALKPLLITGNLVSLDYHESQSGPNVASSLKVVSDASFLLSDYSKSCFLVYLQELSLALFQYGDPYPFAEMDVIVKALKEGKDVLSLAILMLGIFHQNLGIKVNTNTCIHCNNSKDIITFSLKDGGFICKDCLPYFHVDLYPEMDLYVLKYAFSALNEKNLSRVVPKSSGIKIFSELNDNLVDYFDLKPIKSFSMFLQSLD